MTTTVTLLATSARIPIASVNVNGQTLPCVVSEEWARAFEALMKRVGGTVGTSTPELEDLIESVIATSPQQPTPPGALPDITQVSVPDHLLPLVLQPQGQPLLLDPIWQQRDYTAEINAVLQQIQTRVPVLDSIVTLKARSKTAVPGAALVTDYYTTQKGGGGEYVLDPLDTTSADNGGTIIVATDGGRWFLKFNGTVSLRQFGARANGSNDQPFIQAAVTWATAGPCHALYGPAGTYVCASGITKPSNTIGLNLTGDGMDSTIFNFTSAAGLVIIGGSGTLSGAEVGGIGFTGTTSTVLVEFKGCGGQRLRRCRLDQGICGLLFHNDTAGMFTEFCVGDSCDFTANCSVPLHYKLTSGDASFNGSGLVGQCTINSSGAGLVVQIDNGCRPYNAPFHAQIWGNSNCTIFGNLNTSLRVNFYGNITLERFAGTMTLGAAAAGFEVPFVGGLSISNEHVALGQFFLCDIFVATSTGAQQVIGARYAKSQAMVTGANVITGMPYPIGEGKVEYTIHLSAANYDYRYTVETFAGATGGQAPVTATHSTFNVAGYGVPTFTINASNQLVITNGTFPASGVTLFIDAVQQGQSISQAFIGA